MKVIIFFLMIFMPIQAQVFYHPTCQVKIYPEKQQSEWERGFYDEFKSQIKKRKYYPQKMVNSRTYPGELLISYQIINSKEKSKTKLYRDCTVKVQFKKVKGVKPSREDELLIEKSITRRVPRITLGGKERCSKALKEVFIHIPFCKRG